MAGNKAVVHASVTRLGTLAAMFALLVTAAACGTAGGSSSSSGKLAVVATENFWGSILSQLGGDRVQVQSLIVSPDADPHEFDPTPADRAKLARAKYVIVNGAGYDPKVQSAVDATPVSGRQELVVANLIGVKEGGNPHMWYGPSYVRKVVDQMTEDLKKLDSADAGFFDEQHSTFLSQGLKQYDDLRAKIKQQYAGTPVGATESIFVYLADDLGLKLITPAEYMTAISEGSEPTAADKATFDAQITNKQIKVLVFNTQNKTPDVDALVNKAKSRNIPVASVTETLEPASAKFQDWQSKQLRDLLAALGSAR
ncbi:MAG TPA: zinc ABC transporter substrate-binding protein [Candidatus Dormibacteraeota bacterium]